MSSESLNKVDWLQEQSRDPAIARIVHLYRGSSRPRGEKISREDKDVQKLAREWNRYDLLDGILYRTASLDGQEVRQLVMPASYRDLALKGIHDDMGHPGKEKSLWLAKQRFYWPGLERDVNHKVENCGRCIRRKTPTKPVAELVPIQTTHPMELVCIDFLSLERCKGGYENILVITDHFTRYAQAIPCRNQTASVTAKALYENSIAHYSFPERLHSDQGRNFESKVIRELCKLAQVTKTRTTPYHPQGNGSVERFNQSLLKMLGTLDEEKKQDWKSYVATLVQAYNSTKNDSTGFSPHFLMFGWHPRLSVDAYLGTGPGVDSTASIDHGTYVHKLRDRLGYAYKVAAAEASKAAQTNKSRYDRKLRESKLEIGDRVLVRKVGLTGKHKLADRWEQSSYIITDIPNPDIPVYRVQMEGGRGVIKTRTLHRNMLLPFNSIPIDTPTDEVQCKFPQATVRRTRGRKGAEHDSSGSDSSDTDDSDMELYLVTQGKITQREISNVGTSGRQSVSRHSGVADTSGSHHDDTALVDISAFPSQPDSSVSQPVVGAGSWHSLSRDHSSAVHEATQPIPQPRRSVRNRKPPDRFGDWIQQHTALIRNTNVYYV